MPTKINNFKFKLELFFNILPCQYQDVFPLIKSVHIGYLPGEVFTLIKK